MNVVLQTERLVLREFDSNDSGFIVELLNSPGWIEFIGDRNIKTEEQAKNYLVNGPMLSYSKNGFGLSMVELKEGYVPVGMCGLIRREELDHIDIGFAFLPEYCNRGYGYEISKALLTYANEKLLIDKVLAITVPHNILSIKLLEKLGMIFERKFSFPGKNEELLVYSSAFGQK